MSDKKTIYTLRPRSIVKRVFKPYSYKKSDYYDLIAQGLIKNQAGYYNCHSLDDVMTKLGYLTKTGKISKAGREYLFRYFYDEDMAV